jgi:uncharacterized membrane protein
MASSKSRSRNSGNSRNRSTSSAGGRPAVGAGANGKNSSTQAAAAVRATPTSPRKPAGATATRSPKQAAVAPEPAEEMYEPAPPRSGPPTWLQITSLVLAIIGLAISAYETWAHYNGSHLFACSSKPGATFNCSQVITSPQSMVFNIFPVAVLGLAFYVFAVVIFSPWAWRFTDHAIRLGGRTIRITSRGVDMVRLGSAIVGMGFVMYLIYAEFQIGAVCEYCSGVHLVTFLLFCITLVSAALWGLGKRTPRSAARS